MSGGLQIDFAVVSRGGSETAPIDGDVAQDLRLFSRLDYIESAGSSSLTRSRAFAGRVIEHRHIQFAVGIQRARIALFDAEFELPENSAFISVHRAEIAFLRDDINRVARQNG